MVEMFTRFTQYLYEKYTEKDLFFRAVHRDDLDFIRNYLQKYQNNYEAINYAEKNGDTALILAAKLGRVNVVVLLLNAPLTCINLKNLWDYKYRDRTALIEAASRGHHQVVALLLQNSNIDINAMSESGATALYFAASGNYISVIELLLAHRDIDVNTGASALVIAIYGRNLACIRRLLAHPAINVNHRNHNKITPIQAAIETKNREVVQNLLARPEIDLTQSERLLRIASRHNESQGIAELISAALENRTNAYRQLMANHVSSANHFLTAISEETTSAQLTYPRCPGFASRLALLNSIDIPKIFLDPITQKIMDDPITLACGITYDRTSLINWFQAEGNPLHICCPITQLPIKAEELKKHTTITILNRITEFVESQEKSVQLVLLPEKERTTDELEIKTKSPLKTRANQLFQPQTNAAEISQNAPSSPTAKFV